MTQVLEVRDPEEWVCQVQGDLARDFDPAWLQQQAVDAHWVRLDAHGAPRARCSLWWQRVPVYPAHRLGVVGHFAALDEDAACALLQHACTQLAALGCTIAIGPMDGNTWRRYRFVSERGTEPAFFLEPDNPEAYPGYFRAAGFAPLAHYFSALNLDLSQEDSRIGCAAQRLQAQGVSLRTLEIEHFSRELEHIYEVSLASFPQNFLYTPIAREEFLAQYQKVQPYLDPRLTLLAYAQGQPVGFVFGLPDMTQKLRGANIDTMIVKTVAVRPKRASAGLGALLVARVQEAARDLGFKRAIHALMHDANRSANISGHYAELMRGYTLYSRALP